MNFLAHLCLTDGSGEALLGSVLPDLLGARVKGQLSDKIQRYMALHHQIDNFADCHPVFCRSRGRLGAEFARYSGVLVDVFYDHFLARNWTRYTGASLTEFAAKVYRAMGRIELELPPAVERRLRLMVTEDWLMQYEHLEGIRAALKGLGRRSRRQVSFEGALEDLQREFVPLEEDFHAFFPDLQKFAAEVQSAV